MGWKRKGELDLDLRRGRGNWWRIFHWKAQGRVGEKSGMESTEEFSLVRAEVA